MILPIDADQLVPHRGPMLFIDRLVETGPGCGTVEACLPYTSIVVDEMGCIAPLAFVELVAQSVAALNGLAAHLDRRPVSMGYLVGAQSLEVLGSARAEELLTVRVETIGDYEGFTVVDGEVHSAVGVVARTRIKLFVPNESQEMGHASD